MKKILLCAAFALSLAAQNVQDAKANPPAPTERVLTHDEALELQVTILKIHLLNDQFKINDYQAAVAPLSKRQQEIHDSTCLSIGISKDKINTECGISGFDANGDPIIGADGKAVPQRVYRIVPQPVATK